MGSKSQWTRGRDRPPLRGFYSPLSPSQKETETVRQRRPFRVLRSPTPCPSPLRGRGHRTGRQGWKREAPAPSLRREARVGVVEWDPPEATGPHRGINLAVEPVPVLQHHAVETCGILEAIVG